MVVLLPSDRRCLVVTSRVRVGPGRRCAVRTASSAAAHARPCTPVVGCSGPSVEELPVTANCSRYAAARPAAWFPVPGCSRLDRPGTNAAAHAGRSASISPASSWHGPGWRPAGRPVPEFPGRGVGHPRQPRQRTVHGWVGISQHCAAFAAATAGLAPPTPRCRVHVRLLRTAVGMSGWWLISASNASPAGSARIASATLGTAGPSTSGSPSLVHGRVTGSPAAILVARSWSAAVDRWTPRGLKASLSTRCTWAVGRPW